MFTDEFAPPVLQTIVCVDYFAPHIKPILGANMSGESIAPHTKHNLTNESAPPVLQATVCVDYFASHTKPILNANVSDQFIAARARHCVYR